MVGGGDWRGKFEVRDGSCERGGVVLNGAMHRINRKRNLIRNLS